MKDGFSTQIHIRQNDIGQFGKSGQDAVQKIVIFPTCILQMCIRDRFYVPEEKKRVQELLRLTRNTDLCTPVHFDFNHEHIVVEKKRCV